MCAIESNTDLTYPPHVVLNGRKYVPVCAPESPKREYKAGQRWLATDGNTYELDGALGLHHLGAHDYKFTLCGFDFMETFLTKLVRNAAAIQIKPGMLIRGLRINDTGTVLSVNPLIVACKGNEGGLEMAETDWMEVRWPWDFDYVDWQRVYPAV